ncbi:uncharacterized protein Tco025E_00439 [Trypanosoma conorhini]|uniref:Uncharacterized protein n=1 Tax=Trypanosoma conorhini TaxID=83891 RepID=A0A3R7M629_9TRYP|nr:uncharacterized protein Tco025E_00439 [Trypanosoma conorhini]RNF27248.1 hypothetical protein Tco025E_00439 [Trypanosoma conorhini]
MCTAVLMLSFAPVSFLFFSFGFVLALATPTLVSQLGAAVPLAACPATRRGMRAGEHLPVTERSFDVLIRQYEIEAAAARADAAARGENGTESGGELALLAQHIEELATDARRLRRKLQACGSGAAAAPNWSAEDVANLRLLGFDVSGINAAAAEQSCVSARSTPTGQHPQIPNLDKLLAMEKKMQELQTKVDDLTAVNAALRQMLPRQHRTGGQSQGEEHDVSDALAALTEGFRALKDAYTRNRNGHCISQEMQEEPTLASHDIHPESHRKGNTAADLPEYSSQSVEDALCTLRAVSACRRVRYCATGDASGKLDAVDAAVVQLLNDIGFPFPVPIQRLGARGDYFIDRRVEIKLVGRQLVVRPWLAPGAHPGACADGTRRPRYEHLAKYLIHLYSPALDLERVAAGERSDVGEEDAAGGDRRKDVVATLKRQQQELQLALEKRHAQLYAYQRRLEAGLSPSPNASPLRDAVSDSSAEALAEPGAEMNQEASSYPQPRPSAGANGRVAHILRLMEEHGRVPDLSRLSELELQSLKHVTLQRQMQPRK